MPCAPHKCGFESFLVWCTGFVPGTVSTNATFLSARPRRKQFQPFVAQRG